MPDFDLAVIGAGAAGLSVAAGAAQLGARVALIERGRMGGDCLNTGCVPSKALLAASKAARAVGLAQRFGITAGEPQIAWDRVRAYVRSVIDEIAPVDSAERYRALGATVMKGEARFVDPATLSVDGKRVTARRYVVAAGSRAAVPAIPGLDQIAYWTNETLFDLDEKPDHLLILGGGPIGLEMADAFAGLGCQVTVIEAGRIAGKEDPELAAGLRLALTGRSVTILEGHAVRGVTAGPGLTPPALASQALASQALASQALASPVPTSPDRRLPVPTLPVLTLGDGRRIEGSHLLVATGRIPNLEALDLPAGGIQAGPAGIATDLGLRSLTNRRVFAVGDIADPAGIGPRAFTHVGSYHAGIVIRRLLFRLPARIDYAALPRVTYTDPELAQTGMTEAEATAAGLSVQLLRWPLVDNDRAVAEDDTSGMVKLVVSRNRVVGAGILAPHAGEMISQWSLAIAQRTKLSALAGMIVPYPTRSEAGKRAAGMYFASRLFSSRTKALVRLLGRF